MASNRAVDLNGGDDEDEAVCRAIAMSLGEEVLPNENSGGPSHQDTSEPTAKAHDTSVSQAAPREEDDDQDDLRRAIAMSLGEDPLAALGLDREKLEEERSARPSVLGLDRKKMEEERLARLRKRKAAEDHFPSGANTNGPPSRRPRLMNSMGEQPPMTAQARPQQQAPGQHPTAFGGQDASASAVLRYPTGAVLRTWARGVPRGGDIKIEEVFQKDDLELALLSSYQWDEEWFMGKLDMRKTKVLLVAYAASEEGKAEMRNHAPHAVRFVFPPTQNFGCMHSKLQVLKYPKYLRVVVPTGNLVPYDWGETGTMENMVFLIDLPRIEDPADRATNTLSPFGEELSYFLEAQGVEEKMVRSLRNYNFSETSRYGFVHTIAGYHLEPSVWQRTGYCGLGRTIKTLGLDTVEDVELDYICSSIGSLKRDLLAALYGACQGDSGMREYQARTGKTAKNKAAMSSADDHPKLSRIRVYYPCHDTVNRSRGGTNSAGTICLQSKHWDSSTFPREVLRDCKNVRSGVLMHSKVILVQRLAAKSDNSTPGWAYIGSHNLSEAAWGRLVKARDTSQPKLNARNWECGVVISAPNSTGTTASKNGKAPTMGADVEAAETLKEVFRSAILDIPVELPGLPYQNSDRRPWFGADS